MKFVIDGQSEEQPVRLTLRIRAGAGAVELLANGVPILWLTDEGRIVRVCHPELGNLGFQVNEYGQVKCMER